MLFKKYIVDKQNIMDCVATGGNVKGKLITEAVHTGRDVFFIQIIL